MAMPGNRAAREWLSPVRDATVAFDWTHEVHKKIEHFVSSLRDSPDRVADRSRHSRAGLLLCLVPNGTISYSRLSSHADSLAQSRVAFCGTTKVAWTIT